MKTREPVAVACLLALLATGAFAQAPSDTLTIRRATELRESPSESARSIAPLPLQSLVTRQGPRQGPWIEVRTVQGANGWVHMFDAGTTAPAQGSGTTAGALRGITSFFGRGTAQPSTQTATIGIRGLGAEDITNAQPNLEALNRVEAMRVDAAQARQFGGSAPLVALTVAPLPVPALPTQATGTTQPGGGGGATGGTDR